MQFTLSHQYGIPAERFWDDVFFDDGYNEQLYGEGLRFEAFDIQQFDDGELTGHVHRLQPGPVDTWSISWHQRQRGPVRTVVGSHDKEIGCMPIDDIRLRSGDPETRGGHLGGAA